jgi:hypothetical protein
MKFQKEFGVDLGDAPTLKSLIFNDQKHLQQQSAKS